MRKEEKVKELNKKIIIVDVILVVFVVALVFSVLGYIKQQLIATAATVKYDEVKSSVVSEDHQEVDFSVVQSNGSTATSWLYIPGTLIDYPLVQGPDNDYYLDRDAYGNKSKAGGIFINFANAPDMSDPKTVIFGHNMSDGTMFTDLHKYASEDFGKVHQDAYIYMQSGDVKHYKLRYYLFTQPLEPIIYVVSKAAQPLEEANAIAEKADIVYADSTGGNIICLSTCTAHKYRTVVVFEYVDNAKPIKGSEKMEEELDKLGSVEGATLLIEKINTTEGASEESSHDN